MDCERFDQNVIDALYDELDEVTYAALKRHVEGCSRCASTWASLRATREVGILPIEEPPDDLEARILEAVGKAGHQVPWHKNVLRGLAWAGSHAMRPQLAMAAVFVLVIASSLLLLRPHGAREAAPVAVTERGTPDTMPAAMEAREAASRNEGTRGAAAAAPASPVIAQLDGEAYKATDAPAASAAAGATAASGYGAKGDTTDDARSALAEARATRDRSGCASAVSRFDGVAASFPGTQAAADAMWEESICYAQMGDRSHSDQLLIALRSTGYRDRASRELEARTANRQQANAVAAAPAAAARAPAKASAAAGPTAAPANGGMNPRAPAAPRKAVDVGY